MTPFVDYQRTANEVDDNSSVSDDSITTVNEEDERNEVKEVERMSRQDTYHVHFWRYIVSALLVVTACAVTLTTYRFLKQEQYNNFVTAFEQFSRTVGDAAVEQQVDIREAYTAFANIMEAYVQSNNLTWPFVTLPLFETYARDILKQSHTEVFAIFPLVTNENREKYLEYAGAHYEAWVKEGHAFEKKNRLNPVFYHDFMTAPNPEGGFLKDREDHDIYWPAWQYSPPPSTYGLVNWNMISVPDYDELMKAMLELRNETLVTRVRKYVGVPTAMSEEDHNLLHSQVDDSSTEHPHSFVYHPIHKIVDDYTSEIVAVTASGMAWDFSLRNLLPDGDEGEGSKVEGIHSIVRNTCNQTYTYEIDGHDAFFRGEGDFHEPQYDDMEVVVNLALHTHPNFTTTPGHCQFSMHIYPTSRFRQAYDSNTPEIFAGVIAATFALVIIVFYVYDMFVERRNQKLVANAARSNAIVSSLFPSNIRDRLLNQDDDEITTISSKRPRRVNLKSFLNDVPERSGPADLRTKPMADLFLETTVLFADIVGFTAWSSVREPSQVFTLLEAVYSSFDRLAKKLRVFKVETVGDCYVACTGLPDPVHDHAIIMVRFARKIMDRMGVLTKELEVTLGPDTGDLALRVGIHSGPVTGGVLRGDRARFQLFGDTMNTTARIESTSKAGRIHLSTEAAKLVASGGMGHWLEKREDVVTAKGKGNMETFWASRSGDGDKNSRSTASFADMDDELIIVPMAAGVQQEGVSEKTARLIDWNVEMLLRLLKLVVARRNASSLHSIKMGYVNEEALKKGETFLEEVREIIALPEFDSRAARRQQDPDQVHLSKEVIEQLQHYVTCIAEMYRENPFHNFEHASHVVMSVIKLMSRIVAPSHLENECEDGTKEQRKKKIAASLHDHTYGITSDPLTQFACALSALIHDVDHTGVPNTQLIKENAAIAAKFKNRSVAEQNSLDLAWDLLMTPRYRDLRSALYSTEAELIRFRQLVVNSVMATDIVDKDLKALRNDRWAAAFEKEGEQSSRTLIDSRDDVNRKATIVIEHLIQASDVAHTMQHWHIYRKWNENFFEECYGAYKAGRAASDPSVFWYKGEIGFFDFYIIPLAKKLKECGVFGISSDEYLNYAMKNRQEWEEKGQSVVAEMLERINKPNTSTVESEPDKSKLVAPTSFDQQGGDNESETHLC